MKNLSFLIFFVSTLFFAQNQRFTYEYSFKLDSLHRENVGKELMNLDVSKDGSYFYSAQLISRDSLVKAAFDKGKVSQSVNIDMRLIKRAKVNFRVSKKYPSLETTFHASIFAVNMAIKENQKMVWKISPETKTIEGFQTQKATTTFGGRNWTVWFTNDIQVPDGPYKFCGLPGLILTIKDDKGDHIFKLVGSKKLIDEPALMDVKMQEVYVSKEKFNEQWSEYKKDPARNIKLMHASSGMTETVIMDAEGKPLSKQELINRKEKLAKAGFPKFNNFIERDLYK